MTRNVKERVKGILRLPYKRTLVPEDEGGYSALIEEFPGCYAQGETVQEAHENLESTARAWLEANIEEGRSIPQPAAQEEAVSGRILLRLPKSLHRRSKLLAKRDGVSLNQFFVMALTEVVAKAETGDRKHNLDAAHV